MKYRFRLGKLSTKELKDGWLAEPKIDLSDKESQFKLEATQDPKQALIAESSSQAFFITVTLEKMLAAGDVALQVEQVPEPEPSKKSKPKK